MAFRSPPPHRRSSGSVGNKLTKGGKPNKYSPVSAREVTDVVLHALLEHFDGRKLTWEEATAGLASAAFQIKALALAKIALAEISEKET